MNQLTKNKELIAKIDKTDNNKLSLLFYDIQVRPG
jgi:hypothetical protein